MPLAVKTQDGLRKKCLGCGELKHAERGVTFYSNPSSKDGLASRCIACVIAQKRAAGVKARPVGRQEPTEAARRGKVQRATAWQKANLVQHDRSQHSYRLRRQYGLTPQDVDRMNEERAFRCDICRTECEKREGVRGGRGEKRAKILHIDHCHRTGIVRGLLCSRCNTGLGLLRDDPALLLRAIEYLAKSNAARTKSTVS